MAIERDLPYGQSNVLVVIDNGPDAADTMASFQEVTGLAVEISAVGYGGSRSRESTLARIAGTPRTFEVALRRGVVDNLDGLRCWMEEARSGSRSASRTVTIRLRSEIAGTPAREWKLADVRPTKYTGPTLSAEGTDVAIEELVLTSEGIEAQ
jgi:phage tail-like protein